MKKIKIALIQSNAKSYAFQNNLEILSLKLAQLKKQGIEFVVLPEFFPTGNTMEEKLLCVAIQSSDFVEQWLRKTSCDLDMIIAGAYLGIEGKDVYNKFVIQEPNGNLYTHLKTRQPGIEGMYYKVSDDQCYTVDTSLGKIGLITCIEMQYADIIYKDYSDCALMIIVFAIPKKLPFLQKRLIETPALLSKRNGIPVLVCSMGGNFQSNGSRVLPVKINDVYAGKTGIYLPSGKSVGSLPPGSNDILVAEIPLGSRVTQLDNSIKMESGFPFYWRIF